jgi:S1-C subfamily serine protease
MFGKTYSNRMEAIIVLKERLAKDIAPIEKNGVVVGGNAFIVIPPKEIIKKNGIIRRHQESDESVDYRAEILELGFLAMAEVIKRGGFFDTVVITRNESDIKWDKPNYVVRLESPGVDRWQWYVFNTFDSNKYPIHKDFSKIGVERDSSFNVSLGQNLVLLASSLSNEIVKKNEISSVAKKEDTDISSPSDLSPTKKSVIKNEVKIPLTKKEEVNLPNQRDLPPKSSIYSKQNVREVSSGTGFFVGNKGFALTNAHVVSNCSSIKGFLRDRQDIPLDLYAMDKKNDLAILYTSGSMRYIGAKFRLEPPRVGEQVVVFGYPYAGALSLTGNVSEGIISSKAGLFDDVRMLQISAPVQPGNSGGPLLDRAGNVIGVVSSKLDALLMMSSVGDVPQNVNFSIKSTIAIAFLDTNEVDYDKGQLIHNKSVADVADKAKDFTFLVRCFN